MILSATFSKPVKNIESVLGLPYKRVKIRLSVSSSEKTEYFTELYTEKQVFHKKFSLEETLKFIELHGGKTFKNCIQRTETEEVTILANKKGEITRLSKKIPGSGIGRAPEGVAAGNGGQSRNSVQPGPERSEGRPYSPVKNLLTGAAVNKKKNYVLKEGIPVPFLVRLGIMTDSGKVIASKYHKFRQINRFLETLDDILPEVMAGRGNSPVSVVDFGSGKSYLTFAVQYFLSEIKRIDCQVFGLDLKKDVIEYCNRMAGELGLKNLSFAVGNIAEFGEDKNPDIIITLHACDTATDYALDYAVKHGAKAILSVPCCQHEINLQLKKTCENETLESLLKYGLIKERFSTLVTDAVRGELLEQKGYKVQMLEFIDDEGTPKNLMIRAVKTGSGNETVTEPEILKALKTEQTLLKLLKS